MPISAGFWKENLHFFTCVMALSLYMPSSPCYLTDMLKDMDYTCSHLCQVCIFRVGSSYISVLLACGFRVLYFRMIFAGCRVSGQYLQGVVFQDDICSSI